MKFFFAEFVITICNMNTQNKIYIYFNSKTLEEPQNSSAPSVTML